MKISGLRRGFVRLAIATFILTATSAAHAQAQTLPAGWASADIGATWVGGSTQYAGGTYTLAGAGDINGAADSFRFAYRQVSGDVTVVARVVSVQKTHPWSRAGVMMRESLAANSAFGMMLISGSSGSAFQKRVTTGALRTSTPGTVVMAPYWVRLERRGLVVTASQSSNGVAWTTIGTMTMSTPTMYVGLAVASAVSNRLTTGVFDNVLVSTPTTNQLPAVTLTGPANGATFAAPAAITVTATASDTGGTITAVDFFAGTTRVGSDTSSPYSVPWNNVAAGTYSLTAVARDNLGAATTSAARSITVTSANQMPTVSLTGPANGATFTAPATVQMSATASDIDGAITSVDFYAGATLAGTAWTSPYSLTWNNVPAGTYSLTAVAKDNRGGATTSAARTVTVTGPGGLPSGWTAADIGATPLRGVTQYLNGTFTIAGAGDVRGTADSFQFAYRQATGDVTIRARVMSVQNLQPWSKAGVMIRESLAANAAVGMAFVSAGAGNAFFKRLTTGASGTITTGRAVAAPYWVRIERRGSVVTASQSSDGVTWATIDTMTMSAPTMYVGLAVASATSTTLGTGVFDNVTVSSLSANQPPAVSLTSPANGATFTAPASIALAATASDADGTVAGVDFYAGTTLIATDTSSPYTFTWSAVPAGSYALSARARDNSGTATTSTVRTVTVSGASTNLAPTVSLTTPSAGAVFTAPATVAIAATASDPDGSVARVDFYAGAVLIGSDTTSPYSMSWSNVAAGPYALTAVARDNLGAMTVSGARDIRVDSVTLPRTAIFAPSTNHATAVDRYFLEIFPVGANPAVANPVATRDLGKPAVVNGEIQVDISSTTTSLPSGSYIATVTAIGDGGSARSAASPAFTR